MTLTKPDVTTSLAGKWKPYPAYKDSGVEWLGEIPELWEVRRLKFAAKFFGGGTPSKENLDFWSGDIPWISPKDMKAEIVYDAEDHITEYAIEHSATRLIQPGAVLIVVRSGILRHSIPVAINVQPVALNQDMKALVVEPFLKAEYLASLIRGHQHALLMEWRKEGATVESIEFELLANTPCLVPALPEQHAIATFLDRETARINTLIAKKERLVELLQEKRAALISQAVTKGLDPTVPMKDSGIEWLGEIPAHWEVKRLKFVTSFITSGSRGWSQYYSDDGAIFIRIGNLSRTSIDLDLQDIQYVSPPDGTEGERTRVMQHDLLISITAYIGSVAVVSEDIGEAYVNQHIALTRPRQNAVDSKWLGYCLLSQVGQARFRMLLYGGTKDGLGLDDVKNLLILAPPISQQQAITTYLDYETARIDALISRIREGIEKLKEYSTALISAAVTGKIDVRDDRAGVS